VCFIRFLANYILMFLCIIVELHIIFIFSKMKHCHEDTLLDIRGNLE